MTREAHLLVENLAACATDWMDPDYPLRAEAVETTLGLENRFTEEAIAFAVNQQMSLLTESAMSDWQQSLVRASHGAERVIGVLNAGNIPFVELQDLVAVLLAGCAWRGTVSSRSSALLPAFLDDLCARVRVDARIGSLDDVLSSSHALIASGSDDTMQLVAERAAKVGIPPERLWLRGHRFSIAIMDGVEDEEERLDLAEDALLHEGLGCRSACMVFAPATVAPDELLSAFATFRGTFPAHEATSGSLKMQQAYLEALDVPHAWAEGMAFLISRGEPEAQQPGHVRWVPYENPDEVTAFVQANADRLQHVYARRDRREVWSGRFQRPVDVFGSAQRPALDWCPDGRSHVDFMGNL